MAIGSRLAMRGGGERMFRPDALPKNLRHDAVSIYQVRPVELHAATGSAGPTRIASAG